MYSVKKRVTLADVAAATGYTINTVSRALKNKSDISRATCEHIQQVADSMGYVRNDMASSLRSGRSRTIAAIVGNASNPFYAVMVDSIYELAERMGYSVFVMCSHDDPDREERCITTAIGRRVDGIVLYPCAEDCASIEMIRNANIPLVLVSRVPDGADCDCVLCDDEQGAYLMFKHLLDAGHRRLGFFYTNHIIHSSDRRLEGLRRAMREAGIPDNELRTHHYIGDAGALRELRQWRDEGVTGIFAFCDIEALYLISLLNANGLDKVFSVVGFDNIQKTVGFPTPLCTVDCYAEDMTQAAIEILDRRIRGDSSPVSRITLPVSLVCRGGCKPF